MMHRYQVRYGDMHGSDYPYVLWDDVEKRVVKGSPSKVAIILAAQTRNGFKPVDGNEQTYAKQVKKSETAR